MRFPHRLRLGVYLLLATMTVVLLPPQAATAATGPPGWKFWELTRVTSGPTQVFPVISAVFTESRVVLAGALLRRTAGGTTVLPGGGVFSDEGRTTPGAYAGGRSVRCTPDACSTLPARGFNLMGVVYDDKGMTDRTANVIALAAYGVDAQIQAREKGWVLREVRRRATAIWATDGSGADGVHTQRLGVEHFTSATLPGGAKGSLALAELPCSQLAVAFSGAGTGTLTGGGKAVSASCPEQRGSLAGFARGKTTWRLAGPVVGTTAAGLSSPGPVRLLVLSS